MRFRNNLYPVSVTCCALIFLTVSCNLPRSGGSTITPNPAPTGTYVCNATENGMLVGTGEFTIKADGTMIDEIGGQTGVWTYDPAKKEFTITGAMDVDRAVFHPETGVLEFSLKPGITRTHVSGNILACSPQTQ